MGIKSKKIEHVRGVKTFENIRKNVMKQKNSFQTVEKLKFLLTEMFEKSFQSALFDLQRKSEGTPHLS